MAMMQRSDEPSARAPDRLAGLRQTLDKRHEIYSARSVRMGSIRAARHTGTVLAVTVTKRTSTVTPAKIKGSAEVTPTSIPEKSRESRNAAAVPAPIPIIAIRKLWLRISTTTLFRLAPIAIRTLISYVRWDTA